MRFRRSLLLLLFFGFARTCFAADAVTVRISHFGLEGNFAAPAEPTWVEVTARNNAQQPVSFQLVVAEVSLDNDALPLSEVVKLPAELAAQETRVFDIPVRIITQNHAVLYVQALDRDGIPLGRTGIPVGEKMNGDFIAMLCSTSEICRTIRQSILLSGSAEEQTRKSSVLRLIQLSKAAPEGWAYSPADIVILAAPMAQFSSSQRDALEIYLHRGGKLALVDDQLGDSSAAADHSRFLDVYRSRIPEGKVVQIGGGEFVHMKSVSSREFSNHFRLLGITSGSSVGELRLLFDLPKSGNAMGDPDQLNSWLIRRLGTTFRFPSFFELLCWIISYLVLAGVVNFIVLRRIGRPDWAWITMPGLAVLFSLLLYAVGTRNHPTNFGIDEMTVYHFDGLSPLAITTSRVRVSAPVRSVVCPVLPGNLVLGTGQRPRLPFDGRSGWQAIREIQLGATWESCFPLRRWSFSDLDFEGKRRFAGTVFRDLNGRLHNETGLNYRQAIVADSRDVFFLGEFPAGATVDLAHVLRHTYEDETGRRTSGRLPNFPAPPFAHRPAEKEEGVSEEWMKRSDEEFKGLSGQPFALSELLRGWPKNGEVVFSETKAVFFGLSSEATLGAALRDQSPDRKTATLTVVTFGEWP
jgi:hypothetical protein